VSALRTFRIQIGESNIVLKTKSSRSVENAFHILQEQRGLLQKYIQSHPEFQDSMKPIPVAENSPEIVRKMGNTANIAGVGPMAAVAGAISEAIGESIKEAVIVDNGGDIYLKLHKPAEVALYAGNAKISKKLGFRVKPGETPLGICTSSGTVGSSLSFGNADAVTIVSNSVPLADAVATATCNLVKSKEDIKLALKFANSVPGVRGALIVLGDEVGIVGSLPKLINIDCETSGGEEE